MTPLGKLRQSFNLAIPERSPDAPANWCAKNLSFNEAGNRGPFSTSGFEYTIDVLNDFGDYTVTDEVLVWGSQTRKTGTLMGGAAWCVVNDPCGFLWVMPSLTLAQKFARQRWMNLLKASEATQDYVPSGAHRHDFATLTQILGAATFNFVGSNSPANLSSNPCRRVICDEVDKFQEGSVKEASALNLAEQRTKGQVNPQRWKTSTPTVESGLIWQEYLKGSQSRYFVPCPVCSADVLLSWQAEMTSLPRIGNETSVQWDESAKRSSGWDMDAVYRSAHLVCPHCKGEIRDEHKPAMIKSGKWRATNNDRPVGFVSRHLSSLYSTMPETSFGALAIKFLQSKRSYNGLRGFVNGDLAEPFLDQFRSRPVIITNLERTMGRDGLPNRAARLWSADKQRGVRKRGELKHYWLVIRDVMENGDSMLVFEGQIGSDEELLGVLSDYQCNLYSGGIDAQWDTEEVCDFCFKHGINTFRGTGKRAAWRHDDGSYRFYSSPSPLGSRLGIGLKYPPALVNGSAQFDVREPMDIEYNVEHMVAFYFFLRDNEEHGIKHEVPSDVSEEYRKQVTSWEYFERKIARNNSVERSVRKLGEKVADHELMCEGMIGIEMDIAGFTAERLTRTKAIGIKPQ